MSDRPLIHVATPVAPLVMTRYGGAFGVQGFVHSPVRRITSAALALVQGEARIAARDVVLAERMFDAHLSGALEPNYAAGLDGGFYVSAVFDDDARLRDGLATIEAELGWDDGARSQLRLCYARLQRITPLAAPAEGHALVGIAMATYCPEPALFARQIESIRAQAHTDWICVISDDGSSPSALANMEATVGGDPRFVLLAGRQQLGFYRNFERALAALPEACRFLAFSDQDDVWRPDRLSAGIDALAAEGAECAFADMEVVHASGRQLSPSFWVHRRPAYGSLTGLLLANVATGMVMTFAATLRPLVLPFPATPNLTYHDGWIALVAESRRALRYIPAALAQYMQHGGNHTGALTPPRQARLALRDASRRLVSLVSVPLRRQRDPERVKALLGDLSYWSDQEPVRMRVLAKSVALRLPELYRNRDYRRMLRVCRAFGPTSMLRARAGWTDRYRRVVATELVLAGLTRRVVLAYTKLGARPR